MTELTSRERISRQLKRLPVDRIGVAEDFWSFTMQQWAGQGKVPQGTDPGVHFNHDIVKAWPFNHAIDPLAKDRLVAEDDDTRTILDGNGATLRHHKKHTSTPEHLGYAIADRDDWLEKAKPFLTPSSSRISFEGYRKQKRFAGAHNRFFCWSGANVFESIHPACGHENLLMGMGLDPDWISDMSEAYADLVIALMEELFAKEGQPDGIWFYEDLGFKNRPFMSPAMYRELIMPAHKRTIAFAHSLGLPVIMHSCGFVEPLLPSMVEAGIDCLQVMEVQAGMDLLRIYAQFGDQIALMGGLDVRAVASNDLDGIKRELESKIPIVRQNNGFILRTDDSIPESTEYETYRYFLELGLTLGTY